jgi:hypothetical protein
MLAGGTLHLSPHAGRHSLRMNSKCLASSCVQYRPASRCLAARGVAAKGSPATLLPTFTYKPPLFEPEKVPKLALDLPYYDVSKNVEVDVVIAGAGPAGIATAARISSQALRVVVVDPNPLQHWPNNYGVWVDEFEAMGLQDCFEQEWNKANVFLGDKSERYVSQEKCT